jgi:hypothetical protein
MYANEKVLQMSYANYQFVVSLRLPRTSANPGMNDMGKDALVEKFKNSAIRT